METCGCLTRRFPRLRRHRLHRKTVTSQILPCQTPKKQEIRTPTSQAQITRIRKNGMGDLTIQIKGQGPRPERVILGTDECLQKLTNSCHSRLGKVYTSRTPPVLIRTTSLLSSCL
eukprot:scaffold10418_cov106-Cylindrotheca_fusiformis.AAC.2